MRKPVRKVVKYPDSNPSPWVIEGLRVNGKRKRLFFKTEAEAKAELARIETKLHNEGAAALTVTDSVRIQALEAQKQLAEFPGKTIADAVKFYIEHLRAKQTSIPIRDLVSEYLEEQKRLCHSIEHQSDLRNRFATFCKTFGDTGTRVLSSQQIKNWIHKLKVGPQSKNNYRLRLSSLCNYAVERGLMDSNPVKIFKPIKFDSGPPEILSVEELSTLLENASPKLVPALAIKAFTGIRSKELMRLTWEDVKPRGFVEVSKGNSKMKRRRLIPIQPNLADWLRPFIGSQGPIWDGTEGAFLKALEAQGKRAKVKIPNNALRHSFASYHLARFGDENKTALDMGNSPTVIFSNYRELVYPEDAERYFSIRPPATAENIVAMSAIA
jgi:integrase